MEMSKLTRGGTAEPISRGPNYQGSSGNSRREGLRDGPGVPSGGVKSYTGRNQREQNWGRVGPGLLGCATFPRLAVFHGVRRAVRGGEGTRRYRVRAAPGGDSERGDRQGSSDHKRGNADIRGGSQGGVGAGLAGRAQGHRGHQGEAQSYKRRFIQRGGGEHQREEQQPSHVSGQRFCPRGTYLQFPERGGSGVQAVDVLSR